MKSKIIPVVFKNENGLNLFGMLHSPEIKPKDIAIILLSPGIKSRIAPHRLYVKMANCFSEMGFMVLRFDPEGLGDSEGEIEEKYAADVYGSIQVGRFIEDTKSAMDWMGQKAGISKFILSGLCGGAITGLLAGATDSRVVGLLSLGIPVTLDSSNADPAKYITKGELDSLRERYVEKIFNIKAWFRFFSFKSDYQIIFKSFLQKLIFLSDTKTKKAVENSRSIDESAKISNNNFNYLFPKSFKKMVSGKRKILLIFSESDRLFWEFDEKFMRTYKIQIEKNNSNFDIYIAKEANHIFSFKEWQMDMLNKSLSWLEQHFLVD